MAVRAVSSGGLTWGRGGTEPTRCRCDKQHGRAKCSVGPTRKRQGREIAQGGQGRVLVGGIGGPLGNIGSRLRRSDPQDQTAAADGI